MHICGLVFYAYIHIYDSKSYICHSPLIYKVPQGYLKCIRLVIGNTIYAYLFMYVPELYVYVCTIFPMIHVYERLDSALEHQAIM